MEIAKVAISNNVAKVLDKRCVTAGMIGATVSVSFDETWDGMAKTYVWRGNGIIKDDPLATGKVPVEVIAQPMGRLYLGVYGTCEGVATPTVWADLGQIRPGALPSGDETTDPNLPVWAQIREELSCAPVVKTGEPGQSVIVVEVDGSGKPTKWGTGGLADREADALMNILE